MSENLEPSHSEAFSAPFERHNLSQGYGTDMMNITARQETFRMVVDILSTLVEEARFNFEDDKAALTYTP